VTLMSVINVVSLTTLREKDTGEIMRDVDAEYILRCMLRLSSTEVGIFNLLHDEPGGLFTVAEIAKSMNKSRSTIERSLIKLVQLGLVARRPVLAKNGGYTYVYYARPMDYVRKKLAQLVDAYYTKAKELIEGLTSTALIEAMNAARVEE
jgi:predicted transcriptional regulator